jgi:hypothetical protein
MARHPMRVPPPRGLGQRECPVSKLRLWLWAFFGSAFLGLVALYLVGLAARDTSGVTKANFERVQKGMTEQEVESIFGFAGSDSDFGDGKKRKVWTEQKQGKYSVWVTFDQDGKASEAFLFPKSNLPR